MTTGLGNSQSCRQYLFFVYAVSSNYHEEIMGDKKVWKSIPGYPGYFASSDGEIKNEKTGHVTKGGDAGEYLKVSVYAKGDDKPKLCYVHDLVCRAFHGVPGKNEVILHKDDNKKNCKPSNLKRGSQSENIKSAYDNGLISKESQQVKGIHFEPIKDLKDPAVNKLLEEAAKNPFLGDIVNQRFGNNAIVFYDSDKAIGFAMPRQENNYWRVGPIYVISQYRGQGIATMFIRDFFEDKHGRAYIEPENSSSQKAFTAAGFRPTGKSLHLRKDHTSFMEFEKPNHSKSIMW